MLKRNILIFVTAGVINTMAFAMPDMANHKNMDMKGSDHKVMMMQKEMVSMDKKMMKSLGPKDNMYDMRFIDLMIAHHEGDLPPR